MDARPRQKYAGRLRMRLDEIFSEVCATLSPEFLDLIRSGDRGVFAKLNSEYGIDFDFDSTAASSTGTGHNNGTGRPFVIRGTLEQVILAKINLEKCVIVDDDVDLDMAGRPDNCDDAHQDHHPFTRPNANNVMKLRKVKKEPAYGSPSSMDGPVSYMVMSDTRTPISDHQMIAPDVDASGCSTSAELIPSRRKRGRPRKIQPPAVQQSKVPVDQPRNDFEASRNTGTLATSPAVPSIDLDTVEPIVVLEINSLMQGSSSTDVGLASGTGNADQKWMFGNSAPRESTVSFDSYLQDARRKTRRAQEDVECSFKYSCELCSFKAEKEGQLLKHVLIHGKSDSVHKCDLCDFASVSLNHFQRHRLHHSGSTLHCPQCNFETDEPKLLSRHVALRHTLQLATDPTMSDADAQQMIARSSVLQCNECGYSTTKIYHFERHLLVHNRDLKGLLQVYQCEECAYKTHRKEHYVRHKENVHLKHRFHTSGPHYCSYCNHPCRSVEALQRHLTTEHDFKVIGKDTDSHAASLAQAQAADLNDFSGDQLANCLNNIAEVPVKLEAQENDMVHVA